MGADGFGDAETAGAAGFTATGLFAVVLAGAALAAGALAAGAGGRASRLASCRRGALAGAGRLAEDAGVLAAGFRAAAVFVAGRLAPEGLDCVLLLAATRRAAGAALLAARVPVAWRIVRLAIGFAAALGFGRATATRRVAVACLAGAAAFFALAAGRAGLLTALPAEERFPDPLAGVDAFIPAISPSRTGRERVGPSTRLRVPPAENLEPAIPWTAQLEPA